MQFKHLLTLCFFALTCLFVQPLMAQNKTVTGKVSDAKDGSALPGVSVVVKGSQVGTNTDANGQFKLSVPANGATLVFSFVGYTPQEVAATGGAPVNVSLQSTSTALSEVVVVSVGYGSQRKKDVTGAVESISSKDFNQGAVINPLTQIQGKVAGVNITQQGGNPNSEDAGISIRGQTSISGNQNPLFVIDGVATTGNSQFQNLSPEDIESYDVLKDASATSIYGSRGANGVILVTTKKGRQGRAQIDYAGFVGISNQSKYYDLLNATEYANAIKDIPGVDQSKYLKGGDVDWQRAITRTALTHNNNIAVSGGANGFSYRGSVNYSLQEGTIKNNGRKQLGFRFNADQKALNDKLVLSLNLSNTTVYRDQLTDRAVTERYIFNTPPTQPIYNADGTYNNSFKDFDLANPLYHLLETYNKGTTYQTLGNFSANYNLLPSLKIGATGIYIHDNTLTHYFQPTFTNEGNLNTARQQSYNKTSYQSNAHIDYNESFGKHNISATAVYEFNDFQDESFEAQGYNYLVPENLDNVLQGGDASRNKITSSKTEYKIISYLARLNYNYDNRFYLTASVRRDGSDKFGRNSQYGTFPAVNVAYRFKKDLLNNVSWVDDIKLRLGYGKVGNSSALDPYQNITLYGAGQKYFDGGSSFQYPSTYTFIQNPNSDLQWEERVGRNIGLDFSLFNNRLSGDINYYNDKTNKMLYRYLVPTPPFFVDNIYANVGSLTNKGLEIALTGQVVKGTNFSWTMNGQITFNKTKITSLSGSYNGFNLSSDQIISSSASGRGLSSVFLTYLKPGYPIDVFYLQHFEGVNDKGESQLSSDFRYIDPNPKFNYGIGNTFNYNNWSLSFFFRGVYGQKVYNNPQLIFTTLSRLPDNNVTKDALTSGNTDVRSSDRFLENASYLRLDNASLGYTFKNIKGISNLRLYLAGNNIFVITKYKGLDPEVAPVSHYVDGNVGTIPSYPKTRAFVLGANVSFK
ncbi:SusC/RagA family TonB-linked outer membrane protein [Mucilaginibacter conchicola]|uniref:SusC/RagA family TonB-linked outer membrane protein n=1 Tax=Mucilaginibacter conchicola TaxID=2303333 RepID=A0A372NP11_9SPHI|nr:SusC/RagA family TonB-linked outer membrane protein [Mucilaginibacter conchicola]RFZ90608.1 SusC/RagA family TonB-linked outer membrane protein [Mucilaginibacter conchicola]